MKPSTPNKKQQANTTTLSVFRVVALNEPKAISRSIIAGSTSRAINTFCALQSLPPEQAIILFSYPLLFIKELTA